MILQATVNGAVSGDYLIVILVGVTGTLLVALTWLLVNHFISVIKDIRTSLSTMHDSITEIEREQSQMRQDHALLAQRVQSFDGEGIAQSVFLKLRTLREMH